MALRSKRRQAPGYKFPRARDNFYEDSCLERGILDDRLDCFLFYSLGVHESDFLALGLDISESTIHRGPM